ncbi:MAG: Re/Si-specific NAD(P)(+) transhydrogenase subunit alpha [Spirochaetaceae bacterium]
MIIGIPKESFPNENRVALVPAHVAGLIKAGSSVLIESGAGLNAGFKDELYSLKGATITESREEIFNKSDILIMVRAGASNPIEGKKDINIIRNKATVIGLMNPYNMKEFKNLLKEKKLNVFALELIPRISRAQSMDVLSSMASISGYKAAIIAADSLHKIFPMMMTAAGTITPSKILVIGAGVAGLQAIATTHRLGALITGYDIRPAAKEQVESLGAKFLELDLETGGSEDKGGYAKEMDKEFYDKQRELLAASIKASDVVITTALIPGKKAPILITADMVHSMSQGSLIIDLAAEGGGNCELTEPNKIKDIDGVKIIGSTNLPSEVANHSSQLYSKNISNFIHLLIKDGELNMNMEDEIIEKTLICREGEWR